MKVTLAAVSTLSHLHAQVRSKWQIKRVGGRFYFQKFSFAEKINSERMLFYSQIRNVTRSDVLECAARRVSRFYFQFHAIFSVHKRLHEKVLVVSLRFSLQWHCKEATASSLNGLLLNTASLLVRLIILQLSHWRLEGPTCSPVTNSRF